MLDTTPAQQLSIHSGVYFLWPLFLLLFDSVAERTSELEDAIDVDRQLLAISFPIDLQNAVLKSVRVHFAYGSDGRSFFVEYS